MMDIKCVLEKMKSKENEGEMKTEEIKEVEKETATEQPLIQEFTLFKKASKVLKINTILQLLFF